jgi:GAF domain-containing protein
VMRFTAWRGLSWVYRKAVEGHSPWKPGESDPHPICIPDIDGTNEPDSLKSVVREEGIRALAFIPIVANRLLAGKFMAYFNDKHAFSEREIEVALTIARQLGFTIDRSRAEHSRRRMEGGLIASGTLDRPMPTGVTRGLGDDDRTVLR